MRRGRGEDIAPPREGVLSGKKTRKGLRRATEKREGEGEGERAKQRFVLPK